MPHTSQGRVFEEHLLKEPLTREQLESKFREHGVDQLCEVKKACLEGDGPIRVITKSSHAQSNDDDEQSH